MRTCDNCGMSTVVTFEATVDQPDGDTAIEAWCINCVRTDVSYL